VVAVSAYSTRDQKTATMEAAEPIEIADLLAVVRRYC
jgi:hypothetical protein